MTEMKRYAFIPADYFYVSTFNDENIRRITVIDTTKPTP